MKLFAKNFIGKKKTFYDLFIAITTTKKKLYGKFLWLYLDSRQ